MGRRSGFTDEQVFVWLADHLARASGVTVQDVSKGTSVSVGSIYHRYGSMEALLARSWLWAFDQFREVIEQPLATDGQQGAIKASKGLLKFTQNAPSAAILMFIVPERFLVREGIDPVLSAEVKAAKAGFAEKIGIFAQSEGLDPETVELAVVQMPKAVAAKYLPKGEIPAQAEYYVRKTCRMILSNPLTEGEGDED